VKELDVKNLLAVRVKFSIPKANKRLLTTEEKKLLTNFETKPMTFIGAFAGTPLRKRVSKHADRADKQGNASFFPAIRDTDCREV
jgi:hypothetical protein